MTSRRIIRHWKTSILTLLVLTSFILTYLLWNGNWQKATEVGLASTNVLQTSSFPRVTEALTPYRIVLTEGKSKQASVVVPLGPEYQQWLSMLGMIHITNLHAAASVPNHTVAKAEFDFSADVDRVTILTWVPNLSTAILPAEGRMVSLYTLGTSGTVYVAIKGLSTTYVGQTDLSTGDFNQSVFSTIHSAPWLAWDGKSGDYIPTVSQSMYKVTWQFTKLPLLPIVHSFFANPQILTRIQENPSTVLWTDGSQAVQWVKPNHSITFEDPNLTDRMPNAGPDLTTAMSFIRNHGGSPQHVIAFQTENASSFGDANTYTFLPLANGYPIYGPDFSYVIEVYQGHILQYKRPLIELTQQVNSQKVSLLTPTALHSLVEKSLGKQSVFTVQVKLGYYPVIGHSTVTLIPSYYVYESGNLLQIVDASSGSILQKGGQS